MKPQAIEKLNPMISSGKQFRKRVQSITDPAVIQEALTRWGQKYSRNQCLVLEARLRELTRRGHKVEHIEGFEHELF
jgi:hypothetical protein